MAQVAIRESVVPAFESLSRVCLDEADASPEQCSLMLRPGGDGYYQHLLKRVTTLDTCAEELHRVGLDEIQRVLQEMQRLLGTLGCDSSRPLSSWRRLKAEKLESHDGSSVVQDAMDCIASVEDYLDRIVIKDLAHPVRVNPMSPYMAEAAGDGYYEHPSCLTEGYGVLHVDTLKLASDVFSLKTLTVHETIPGHHLQYVYLYGDDPLPAFRSVLPFQAYTEGWALYAERLMQELGFYDDDPIALLACLEAQLRRSSRLVLDTGIHGYGWSMQDAYRRLHDMIGESEWARAEIKRVCIEPASGCAYKIGELEIMKIRERQKEGLGSRFDLKHFHHELLRCGPCPFGILEQRVDQCLVGSDEPLSRLQ